MMFGWGQADVVAVELEPLILLDQPLLPELFARRGEYSVLVQDSLQAIQGHGIAGLRVCPGLATGR